MDVLFCRRRRSSEAAWRVSSFLLCLLFGFRFPSFVFLGPVSNTSHRNHRCFLFIDPFYTLIPAPSILFDRLHTLLYPSGSQPCACNIPRTPVLILELYTYPFLLRCFGLACIPSISLFNKNVVFIQLRPFFDSSRSR